MLYSVRVFAALLEDSDSIPRTHMEVHNHLQLQLQEIQCMSLASMDTRLKRGTEAYGGKMHKTKMNK